MKWCVGRSKSGSIIRFNVTRNISVLVIKRPVTLLYTVGIVNLGLFILAYRVIDNPCSVFLSFTVII